jgi:hypothetical protein
MRTMQTKTGRQQSSAEQQAFQARPGFAGQRRSDSPGNAGVLPSLQRSHGNRYVQRLLDAAVQRGCGCGTCADCGSKLDTRVGRIRVLSHVAAVSQCLRVGLL